VTGLGLYTNVDAGLTLAMLLVKGLLLMGGGGGVATLLEILLNVLAPDAHDDTVIRQQ